MHGLGADAEPGRLARGRRQADRAPGRAGDRQHDVPRRRVRAAGADRLRRGRGRGRQGDRRRAGEGDVDARGRPHPRLLPSEHAQRVPGRARRAGASRPRGSRARSGRAPPPAGRASPPGQVDNTSMAGLRDLPYDIPNVRIEWVDKDVGVPIGFWRSVGLVPERVHRRDLHRRAGAPGRPGPVRVPARAPRQVAPPQGRPRAGRDQGGLGHAAAGGTGRAASRCASPTRATPAHVAEVSVADDGAVRDPPPRVRDRLRDRGQPGSGQGADGRRRGLRDDGDALRPDHARRRARPADELPHLPDDADRRDARHRGAHPGVRPGAGRAWASPACRRSRRPICNAIFAATGKRIRRLPIQREALKRA